MKTSYLSFRRLLQFRTETETKLCCLHKKCIVVYVWIVKSCLFGFNIICMPYDRSYNNTVHFVRHRQAQQKKPHLVHIQGPRVLKSSLSNLFYPCEGMWFVTMQVNDYFRTLVVKGFMKLAVERSALKASSCRGQKSVILPV